MIVDQDLVDGLVDIVAEARGVTFATARSYLVLRIEAKAEGLEEMGDETYLGWAEFGRMVARAVPS